MKNSQQNSRKNSIGFKDQFWNSLQNTMNDKQKINKINNNNTNNNGKENTNITITTKQRLSYNSKENCKEE